jgi:lipopolysaccharide/colanic/teichoic acid biosynthesis glycosyltransferase
MYVKLLFDKIFSFLFIILTLPVFIVICVLIKLDSEGPVFFVEQRVGKDNRLFDIYKFRTMIDGAVNL